MGEAQREGSYFLDPIRSLFCLTVCGVVGNVRECVCVCEGECVRGMCEGKCGNIDQLNTYCNDRHMLRLTGVGAAVRLSCRPSNSPPLASLTRHTLFSDWSKSFNAQYIHTHQCATNTAEMEMHFLTMVSKLGLMMLV